MFSGIIKARSQLLASETTGSDRRLTIALPDGVADDAQTGDSMAVSGVCLTMLEPGQGSFKADVSMETLKLTTLGALEPGDAVNLEPALLASDRLGGHLVSGHVDGLGSLRSRRTDGRAERFEFSVPDGLAKYIARKGSICIDGVSLTVNGVNENAFDVCIIPHTLEVTTLGLLQDNDPVNLEVDMVARYIERLLPAQGGA